MSLFAMLKFLADDQEIILGAKLTLKILFFSIKILAFRPYESLHLGLSKSP